MNLRYPLEIGRSEIVSYIRREAKKGHYPGRHEIQEKLGIWLYSYFNDVREPYNLADIDISKSKSNPFIATEKEKKLTKVSLELLEKEGFNIIEIYRRKGSDILVKDCDGNLIPVELKAYHRNNNLPMSKIFAKKYKNEIEQLEDYIRICKAPYGILITTTNRIRIKIPFNVKLINGISLIRLLKKNKLNKCISTIKWIQNTYSSFDRKIHENKIKKSIIEYVRFSVNKGCYPSMRNIEKKFKVNITTYFKNMSEIYKIAKVELSSRFLSKEEVKNRIVKFIRLKVKLGRYPSLEEIEKKFKIHLKTYFKNSKEMYTYSNVSIPCKHLSKKEAIKTILKYAKMKKQNGKNLTIRQIDKEMHISAYSYFKNASKLYNLINS